ncbi:unnamed protein product [Rotaria sp. Silwood1]|nr:unnamed protein product [Rotaria sp. Silwood1]
MSNRQTFHPNKLDYDVFNIKINIGPIDLFENIFGLNQMYHDIHEPDTIREKKIIVYDDSLVDIIDEIYLFDPRYFRPLMATLRVALHNYNS